MSVKYSLSCYKDEQNRLDSFVEQWPDNAPVAPAKLASAGWFYTGPGDSVQCPWCRGKVSDWPPGSDALAEHKRRFPHCEFIIQKIESMLSPVAPLKHPASPPAGKRHWRDLPAVHGVVELGMYDDTRIRRALYSLETRGNRPTVLLS